MIEQTQEMSFDELVEALKTRWKWAIEVVEVGDASEVQQMLRATALTPSRPNDEEIGE